MIIKDNNNEREKKSKQSLIYKLQLFDGLHLLPLYSTMITLPHNCSCFVILRPSFKSVSDDTPLGFVLALLRDWLFQYCRQRYALHQVTMCCSSIHHQGRPRAGLPEATGSLAVQWWIVLQA